MLEACDFLRDRLVFVMFNLYTLIIGQTFSNILSILNNIAKGLTKLPDNSCVLDDM